MTGGYCASLGNGSEPGSWKQGVLSHPETGVVQGGTISPVSANIFLHQVLDVWFEHKVQLRLKGRSFLIRFAAVVSRQSACALATPIPDALPEVVGALVVF